MSATMISNEYMQQAAQQAANSAASPHLQALNLLCAMGWHYLPASACLAKRGNRRQVLLQSSLVEVLQTRRYVYNGQSHLLTPNGIEQIVRELSAVSLQQGLGNMNTALYEKLRLGITITEFLPDGKKHQPTIAVIDWQNRKANRFEVCEMMDVLASQGKHSRCAGLVCFINGIPVAILEAANGRSDLSDEQLVQLGIERHLQHQQSDEIAHLYAYAQLLFSLGLQDARFGTVTSPAQTWSRWREEQFSFEHFSKVHNTPLSVEARSSLQAEQSIMVRNQLKRLWSELQIPQVTHQLLISLLSPQRLLEYLCSFVAFDSKRGKMVARSQQFFAVRAMIERISVRNERGARQGGVVWHSNGCGKTMSMVFLSKALMVHEGLKECRMVIVTERGESEAQLHQTFIHCGGSTLLSKNERAKVRSGHDLARRISSGNERIIFTLMHKFQAAASLDLCYNPSHQLIVLVDEGQRGQYAELQQRMRKALPRAAFIALTGSASLQREKDHNAFGPILHAYPMQLALQDQLLLPVLYEERAAQIDQSGWREALLQALPKFEHDVELACLDRMLQMAGENPTLAHKAWDIALHFKRHIKPFGWRGQVLCSNRREAMLYQRLLRDCAHIKSGLLIHGPDLPEGNSGSNGTHEADLAELQTWWQTNIGTQQENYEQHTLHAFAQGELDLLIMVDRLDSAGAQATNGVLYIDKVLREHALLQVFDQVNRPAPAKRYGILMDYRAVLAPLDFTLRTYRSLDEQFAGFERPDIEGMLRPLSSQALRLPQLQQDLMAHFDLHEDIVRPLLNDSLREHLRQSLLPHLGDSNTEQAQQRRDRFYVSLLEFAQTLQLALSARNFLGNANHEAALQRYKHSLEFFSELRLVARQDAQEDRLLDQDQTKLSAMQQLDLLLQVLLKQFGLEAHFGAGQGKTAQVSNQSAWSTEKLRNEIDLTHNRLRKIIEHELADDPYAQHVYANQLAHCLAQVQTLQQDPQQQYVLLQALEEKIKQRHLDAMPEIFQRRSAAASYYGLFRLVLGEGHFVAANAAQQSAYIEQALAIDDIVQATLLENTLNLGNVEAIIRSKLLPRLFLMLGMDQARRVIEQIVRIALVRARA